MSCFTIISTTSQLVYCIYIGDKLKETIIIYFVICLYVVLLTLDVYLHAENTFHRLWPHGNLSEVKRKAKCLSKVLGHHKLTEQL